MKAAAGGGVMGGHTPGPWAVRPSHDGSGDVGIMAPNVRNVIAECFAAMRSASEMATREAQANARLIAAAPDLLTELKRLRHAFYNALIITGSATADDAAAAVSEADRVIAKATGEP